MQYNLTGGRKGGGGVVPPRPVGVGEAGEASWAREHVPPPMHGPSPTTEVWQFSSTLYEKHIAS